MVGTGLSRSATGVYLSLLPGLPFAAETAVRPSFAAPLSTTSSQQARATTVLHARGGGCNWLHTPPLHISEPPLADALTVPLIPKILVCATPSR